MRATAACVGTLCLIEDLRSHIVREGDVSSAAAQHNLSPACRHVESR